MQEQANPIITSIFTDILQNTIVCGLLIVAVIFLAKFIKKSEIKHGKLLFILGYAYLGKELLITISALIKSIFITSLQAIMSSGASQTALVSTYQTLNEYNVWFIIALVIVIGLFFVVKPKNNVAETNTPDVSEDMVTDEEIQVSNLETKSVKTSTKEADSKNEEDSTKDDSSEEDKK